MEESINEARSILSFGKSYCRKNRVHGMIVISENRLSFIVQENDYKIDARSIKVIRRYTVSFECNYDGEYKEVEHKLIIAKINNSITSAKLLIS